MVDARAHCYSFHAGIRFLAAAGYRHGAARNLKTQAPKINRDGLEPFQQVFVDNILKACDLKNRIRVFRLVQSQGQGRTASPTRAIINTNRRFIDALEISCNLCGCCRRYGKHLHSSFRGHIHLYSLCIPYQSSNELLLIIACAVIRLNVHFCS
jgi:hypothetical protein